MCARACFGLDYANANMWRECGWGLQKKGTQKRGDLEKEKKNKEKKK
jgi:hypothetical protein